MPKKRALRLAFLHENPTTIELQEGVQIPHALMKKYTVDRSVLQ